MAIERLKARQIERLKEKGSYPDGGGLYLQVTEDGRSKSWIFRYAVTRVIDGKTVYRDRQMGLGPLYDVPLDRARALASQLRDMRRRGLDPLDEKRREDAERREAIGQIKIFRDVVPPFLARYQPRVTNTGKRAGGWTQRYHWTAARWLDMYVLPKIGDLAVYSIDEDVIANLLRPIQEKAGGHGGAQTANGIRVILKQLFDFAGHPSNPASRAGRLKYLLPDTEEVHETESHPALPIDQVVAFLAELRNYRDRRGNKGNPDHVGLSRPMSALALEFIILLPVRSHQVAGLRWDEIKWNERKWICPKERTKTGRAKKKANADHVLPLTDDCMAILEEAKKRSSGSEYVFSEGRLGNPIERTTIAAFLKRNPVLSKWTDEKGRSIHVHGFRTTFQSWAVERYIPVNANGLTATQLSDVVLDHDIHSDSAMAKIYARLADHTNPLRHLLQAWAQFCNRTEPPDAKVLPFAAIK
jgi:integrase